jgi:hypothetical protein
MKLHIAGMKKPGCTESTQFCTNPNSEVRRVIRDEFAVITAQIKAGKDERLRQSNSSIREGFNKMRYLSKVNLFLN